MEKLTKKLLNGFLLSGIIFFCLVAFTFVVVQIWPVIWDEWNAYKKGEDLKSAKIVNIRLLKNDFFSQTYINSLEACSLKEWRELRRKNSMISPNGASDYYLEQVNNDFKLQLLNLKDNIIYSEISRSFNPLATEAPKSFSGMSDDLMPLPKDIINDSLQIILKKNDSTITQFSPFVLKNNLNIGAGFEGRKNKEIRMLSKDGKILIYVEFELTN